MVKFILTVVAVALGVAIVVPSLALDDESSSSYSYSFSYDIFQMRPCAYNGTFRMHGERWSPLPCATCVCKNLNSVCTINTCPVCYGTYTEPKNEKQCCGKCKGRSEKSKDCFWRGKTYQHGKSFALNDCTDCQCYNGKARCIVRSCFPAQCENASTKPGACCETCPVEGEA